MELIALKQIVYGGKKYYPGDRMTATRKDGRALVCIKKAIPAPELYIPPPVEEVIVQVEEKMPKVKPAKRTYNRRDMVAKG